MKNGFPTNIFFHWRVITALLQDDAGSDDHRRKGKVERFFHYCANNFWVEYKGTSLDLDELNEAILRWIAIINTNTVSGLNESRQERFNYEKRQLTLLLLHSFDCRRPESVRVSTESLVRVKGNWYSVPPEYKGRACIPAIQNLEQGNSQ
jgi:hypothetical protein